MSSVTPQDEHNPEQLPHHSHDDAAGQEVAPVAEQAGGDIAVKRPWWLRLVRGIGKTVVLTIAIVVFLVTTLLISLHIPSIQRRLVTELGTAVTDLLKHKVEIGYVYISWLDTLVMKDVIIHDTHGEVLISVKDLRVRFALSALFQHDITVRAAYLDQPTVNMIKYPGAEKLNINEFVDAILEATYDPKAPYNPDPVGFLLRHAVLEDGTFHFDDRTQGPITGTFDYLHMDYSNIQATVEDFTVQGKFIGMNVKALKAHEVPHSLELNHLQGYLSMDSTYMKLHKLQAQIGRRTRIANKVEFHFRDWAVLPQFNDSVRLVADMDTAFIDFDDLRAFAPTLPRVDEVFWVKSHFDGKICDFKIRNFTAGFGDGSLVKGNLEMKGLPDWQQTRIVANVKEAKVRAADLLPFFPEGIRPMLATTGTTEANLFYKGTPENFSLFADASTAIGKVTTAFEMDLRQGPTKASYKGKLFTEGFDLGTLISQQEQVQKLDVNTNFDGKGFTQESLRLLLNGTAASVGIRGYAVKNAVVNGEFAHQVFAGVLKVNDPNLQAVAEGKVDLKHKPEIVDVDLNLTHANLSVFKLLPDITHVGGHIRADLHDADLDNLRGYIMANDLSLRIKGQNIELDEVALRKYESNGQQVMEADCDWANLKLQGEYKPSLLAKDLTRLVKEYAMLFRSNPAQQRAFYAKEPYEPEPFGLSVTLKVNNPKPLLRLYAPTVNLSNDWTLDGTYSSGGNAVLILNTNLDTVSVGGNSIYNLKLDVNASKSRSSQQILASAHARSDVQELFGMSPMRDLEVDVEWKDQDLNFNTHILQDQPANSIYNSSNELTIGGLLHFYEDKYVITLDKSALHLLDADWQLDAQNQLSVYYDKAIQVNQFRMENEGQSIYAKGALGASANDILDVKVDGLDLNILTSIVGKRIEGIASADVVLRSALAKPDLRGFVSADSLMLEGFLLGDVSGKSTWDNDNQWLNVDLDLLRTGQRIIKLDGHYDTKNNKAPLNLRAQVSGLPMKVMEGFLGSIMTNWAGTATGLLDLTGNFDSMVLDGSLQISGGVFKYNYLNTTYRFNDRIDFSRNLIEMDGTRLIDVYNQRASIKKLRINHTYFRDYGIDLEATLDNFQVVNTTQKDNPLYYGNVTASGPFRMKGPFDNLFVGGQLSSGKGTLVNIPIRGGSNESEKLSFIQFVDSQKPHLIVNDSTAKKMNLQGITMDFTLDITPDAEIDIVFNPRNGELIKAQGNGVLKLSIDTRGDFTMLGQYTITKGTYNFIFLNAINKKFDLQNGSTLTWTGSPTGALMKINARHTVNTSLRPLVFSLDSAELQRPELRRKYPVTVLMDITGDLLKPNISFGLEIDRTYPQMISGDVQTFEARLLGDQQELNRQVFYLFVVRSLAPVSTVSGQGAGDNVLASSSSSTISEMLSNQISNLLSTVDQNFSIDIDVNGWDANALTALQLRLSYSLLEGRLRIARSGGVTNAQNQATAASLAGDWMVEYMLSKEGTLRLRGFIRNNQVMLGQGFSTQQNTTTSGFTVLHTQSFDRLSELIPKVKPRDLLPLFRLDLRPDSLIERDTALVGPKPAASQLPKSQPVKSSKTAKEMEKRTGKEADKKNSPQQGSLWPVWLREPKG